METVRLSSKYQVVIPKALRKQLAVKPGQKVYLTIGKSGEITISTVSHVDKLYGSMKGAWGKASDAHIRQLRDEANRDRA